jgi:predicted Ser/Thr protein kinase
MVFLVEWKQEKYALKKMRLNDDSGEALKEAQVLG